MIESMTKQYWVYIVTNENRSTLYIGMTNNLERRLSEHRLGEVDGFTKRYHVKYLMYFEDFSNVQDAITREKQLKKWKRTWKNELIEVDNPNWMDLSADWV